MTGLQKSLKSPFHVIYHVTHDTHIFLQVVLASISLKLFRGSKLAFCDFGLVVSSP